MNKDPSLKEVISTLRLWQKEASNPRNDGWVQEGYRQMIKTVFKESGSLLNK